MLGHRALSVQDYLGILKRKWWIIAIPAVIFPIIGYGITFFISPSYVSQTLVLIEQQKVPDSYVKPVITEDLTQRLASMREQILSRSRLQPIIERFNLYANSKMSMDDRIDATRKNIGIAPIQSDIARTAGLPGFYITFKASDPRTAQLVCGEITSLFISANLSDRAASAAGTTDFLKSQLDDAKARLDEESAALAKFQQQYMGRLPGSENGNINMMQSLNAQLEASTQALQRMEQERSYQESLYNLQQGQVAAMSGEHGKASASTLEAQLAKLEEQEAELSTRYTDDYPDVIAVRRQIKDLQTQIATAPPVKAAAPSSTSAPVKATDSISTLQFRAQIKSMDAAIAEKKREQGQLQGQIKVYEDKVASSPAIEEEYKNITRDNETAQAFYDDLLNKMNQSKMATDLEKRQQGEQFRVMDEPNLPEEPTSPKRSIFLFGGFAVGLGLGLLIVAALEYMNTALRSERDIWAFTKLPTLGVIGFNGDQPEANTKRRWFGRGNSGDTGLPADAKPAMNAGS